MFLLTEKFMVHGVYAGIKFPIGEKRKLKMPTRRPETRDFLFIYIFLFGGGGLIMNITINCN